MNIELKNPKIYVISGKARSGKDTTTEIIKEYYEKGGKKVINLAYGQYIKEYAKRISDWDGNDDTKPRTLLQTLGTEIIRNKINPMFFIERMIGDIKVYSYYFDVIIISDARLKTEITTIKETFDDVIDIGVRRPNFDNCLSESEKNHSTENDLNDYDSYNYIIQNDSSIEDLREKIIKMIEEVENERKRFIYRLL